MYPYSTQYIQEDDQKAVIDALCDENLTQGWRVKEFESQIAHYCGVQYALAFNSATSALYAAYHSIKQHISQSPLYAITTPISFVATTNMMLANNITPIFADIDAFGNLDSQSVREILTSHPQKEHIKLLVSMDYGGRSVNCEQMHQIAQEYNLIWISDSSHSFGGCYKGEKIGSQADISIFSFHAIKPITTAEGGALLTNDERIYHSAQLTLSHSIVKTKTWHYDCVDYGFNFRMNELSAALGISQLSKIESFIAKREEIVRFYHNYCKNNPFFTFLPFSDSIQSTHHLCPIFLHKHFWTFKEDIFKALHKRGVGVQVHYIPIYHFSLYKRHFGYITKPNAEYFYKSELSIPCAQTMNINQAKEVANIILDVLDSYQKV